MNVEQDRLHLATIHIHPVKSLGGFSVAEARLTDRGLEHDRRWMLVDAQGRFLSQRELPQLACLHTAPLVDGFRVTDRRDGRTIELPWALQQGVVQRTQVWSDPVDAIAAPHEVNAWFRQRLGQPCQLVYMPDAALRPTDTQYADALTALSDGFPYLIISQASLDDLNARLDTPIPMDRFRPNLVIAGGESYQEDKWRTIRIGTCTFQLVKPCSRCVITTTDQRTGARGKEPLRTLATYRKHGHDVNFGMNAVVVAGDVVRVGDLVHP